MTKMTYVNALSYVLEKCEMPADVREKLDALKEQQVKRNSSDSGKPTKKQAENVALADALFEVMKRVNKPCTVSEYMAQDETFGAMTNQKVSALMRVLESSGKVVKTTEKRKSYFAVAG